MTWVTQWSERQQPAECALEQQFGAQASRAVCEASHPHNEFLTIDATEKRSRLRQHNGHKIQVESIIICLMIMSQLWYTDMEGLGGKTES